MESEGEIDTWNEITLNKLNSNLNEVDLPSDRELILAVYSQRLDYKYLGCTIYDRCESQQKLNGDISYTTEYVCEIWLMK